MATLDTYTPDFLRAGDFPMATKSYNVTPGVTVRRGMLLGTKAGESTLDPYPITAGMTLVGIGLDDLTAVPITVGSSVGVALSGQFDSLALAVANGGDIDDYRAALRDLGIFVVDTQAR